MDFVFDFDCKYYWEFCLNSESDLDFDLEFDIDLEFVSDYN
jgi:hypothetical protein